MTAIEATDDRLQATVRLARELRLSSTSIADLVQTLNEVAPDEMNTIWKIPVKNPRTMRRLEARWNRRNLKTADDQVNGEA